MRLAVAAVFAFGLAACGSDGDDQPPVERPISFGGARPVDLQVPDDFDPSRTYPLLLILHGYGANGFAQQGYFKLADVATAHQMLVLAPTGTVDSGGRPFWNADTTCCDMGGTGVDDVAYLGGLLDDVRAAWPVDPAHVDVLGHSNGAFMAYRMACERADVVTAIAGLAGHAIVLPCAPSAHVNVLHIHGTADETVPYETGVFAGIESPGAVDSIAEWAGRNGCTGAPAVTGTRDLESGLAGAETEITPTGGCPAGGAADLWTIDGGMHLPQIGPAFPTELLAWLDAHGR